MPISATAPPSNADYFLTPARDPHERKPLPTWYQNLLEWALDHRILTVVLGTLLFIGSVALVAFIPTDFRPVADQDFLYVELQGPPGATVADMQRGVQDATRRLLARPEVDHVFAQVGSVASSGGIGGGSSGGDDLRTGTLSVTLHPERELSVSEFKLALRDSLRQIPHLRATFQGNAGAADLSTILAGDDGAALDKTVLDLERQMRRLDVVTDVRSSSPPPGPEIVVRPTVEAARLGVSSETLASVVRIATIGDIDANVAKFTDGERRIPTSGNAKGSLSAKRCCTPAGNAPGRSFGGLITSTALSLVFVPVVYEFIDDIENWLKPKLGRFVTPRDLDDEAEASRAEVGP